jgi:molybdopterin-binding protein
VINNYTTNNQRYNYTNVTVKEKPHNTVVNRIQQNETIIQKGKKENAAVLQQQVKSIKEGRVNREVRIEQPKTTNYIVPASEVNRPKSEIKLQQREIKTSGKPGEQEKPVARPERVAPAKPIEKGVDKSKKVEKPESVTKEGKPQEKVEPGKPKETIKPPERGAVEKPKEVKPQERAIEKPKVKLPERAIEKPKEIKPLERAIEKPKDAKPPERTIEKQIEKPKEPRTSEKDLEKRKERKPSEEEGEKPR